MRIDSSGNVGIGAASPARLLHVQGSAGVIRLDRSVDTASVILARFSDSTFATVWKGYTFGLNASGLDDGEFIINDLGAAVGGAGTRRFTINNGGEVIVGGTTDNGAYNLQCNGTGVWGAGAYTNGSDARIKENVAPIQSGLSVVEKLNPVTFNYLESWSRDRSTQTGFIAQELQTALADEVYVDGIVQQGPEYMSVAYQSLIPILTKAIQEQQQQIDALKAEVAALKGE